MGYMDNKAPLANASSVTVEDLKASSKTSGNQEKNAPIPKRSVSITGGKFNSGGQVKIGGNPLGTGTLKDPLNSYKKVVLGTAPDKGVDRSGNKVATGKAARY